MSEPENFLERWSRRKRAAAEEEAPRQDKPAPSAADEPPPAAADAEQQPAEPEAEPFDLSSLPSLESIDANTNVSAFLRPGVPADLTREALRRAWTSDPAIRDFVGLVENGWDFNDPNAMHGFGTITPSAVARLIGQVVGLPDEVEKQPNETNRMSANDSGERTSSASATQADDATIPFSEPSRASSDGTIAAPQDEIGDRDTAPERKSDDHA
jgi:Protein of unknown function (DUF3306)